MSLKWVHSGFVFYFLMEKIKQTMNRKGAHCRLVQYQYGVLDEKQREKGALGLI